MKKEILLVSIILSFLFINGWSQNSKKTIPEPIKNQFGTPVERLNNFTGTIYFLPINTTKLPDLSTLTPRGKIYTDELNVKDQYFKTGFPQVTDRFEFFAIDYKGQFYLRDSTLLLFMLGSDDGSKLIIDNELLINNDELHSMIYKYKSLNLARGFHSIEVQYFQGPKYNVGLILKCRKFEDANYQVFNLFQYSPVMMVEKNNIINLTFEEDILYETNQFKLNLQAMLLLADIKRILIDKLELEHIVIEGYTDDVGSNTYNLKLSEKRANAVKEYYYNTGVPLELLSIKGMGKTHPKYPNNSAAHRQLNRRIEIQLIKTNKDSTDVIR